MNGPQGVGALFARRSLLRRLRSLNVGGGHENGLRSGTYNTAGIVGMGLAATLAANPADIEHNQRMRDLLQRQLTTIPDVVVHGAHSQRLPNTTNLHLRRSPRRHRACENPRRGSLDRVCMSRRRNRSLADLACHGTRSRHRIKLDQIQHHKIHYRNRNREGLTSCAQDRSRSASPKPGSGLIPMRLHEACSPTFARHETFHPKLGGSGKACCRKPRWRQSLPRTRCRRSPRCRQNMVRSIRFWTTAAASSPTSQTPKTIEFHLLNRPTSARSTRPGRRRSLHGEHGDMVVDPLDDAVTGFTTPGLVDPAERAQRNRIRRRTGALRRRKRTRAKSLGKAKRLVDRQRHQRIHPHLRPIRRGRTIQV